MGEIGTALILIAAVIAIAAIGILVYDIRSALERMEGGDGDD